MKKTLALLLALSMIAVSVSCGKKEENTKKNDEGVDAGVTAEILEESEDKAEIAEEKAEENSEAKPEVKAEEKAEEKTEEKAEEKTEEKAEEKKPEINYNTEKDKAAAKDAAESFMSAFAKYDIAAMSGVSNADIAKKIGYSDLKTNIDAMIKGSFDTEEALTVYADEINEVLELSYNVIMNNTTYELGNAKYSDGKWSFDVKISAVTLSDIRFNLQSDEGRELVDQVLPDELLLQLEAEGGEVSPELIESIVNGMLAGSLRIIKDACENAEPTVGSYALTAVKSGDKWLIDCSEKGVLDILGLIA